MSSRTKSREFTKAVDVIVRAWLRHSRSQKWPVRDRLTLATITKAFVQETPFWQSERARAAIAPHFDVLDLPGCSLTVLMERTERAAVVEALERTRGVQVEAARLLGISQRSMWHRVKKHRLEIEQFRKRG